MSIEEFSVSLITATHIAVGELFDARVNRVKASPEFEVLKPSGWATQAVFSIYLIGRQR